MTLISLTNSGLLRAIAEGKVDTDIKRMWWKKKYLQLMAHTVWKNKTPSCFQGLLLVLISRGKWRAKFWMFSEKTVRIKDVCTLPICTDPCFNGGDVFKELVVKKWLIDALSSILENSSRASLIDKHDCQVDVAQLSLKRRHHWKFAPQRKSLKNLSYLSHSWDTRPTLNKSDGFLNRKTQQG